MGNTAPTASHWEIRDAFYSVLPKDVGKEVWWISVGLVNDSLGLDWHSFVNHESDHAKEYCRGNSNAPVCEALDGHVLPPCVLDRIKLPCSFRTALNDLEVATMHPKAHSQGRISILYWEIKKEAPYISKEAMPFSWLKEKESALKELLGERRPPLDKTDPSNYEEHAKACMNSKANECSAALIPLLQHRALGDNAYVGAIAVCATRQSEVWGHLPHIRAVATSLLETRRHLKAIISKKDKDFADLMFDELIDNLDENQNLFAGKCSDTDCQFHRNLTPDDQQRKRHDYECRIARKASYFVGALGKKVFYERLSGYSWKLQKSLFCFGRIQSVGGFRTLQEMIRDCTPSPSHATTLGAVRSFFWKAFGVWLDIGEQRRKMILWPRRPGLFTAVGLYDVYRELNPTAILDQNGPSVNPPIKVVVKDKNRKSNTISFSFTLKNLEGAQIVKKRIKNELQGAITSNICRVCACLPTRAVMSTSREDAEIIRILNTPAYKAISAGVNVKVTPPILYFEWAFPKSGLNPD